VFLLLASLLLPVRGTAQFRGSQGRGLLADICLKHTVLLRITGFLDFVDRPVLKKLENSALRKLDPISSSGEGGDIYTVGSVKKT
jgi:hypothetical protein